MDLFNLLTLSSVWIAEYPLPLTAVTPNDAKLARKYLNSCITETTNVSTQKVDMSR